MLLEPQKSSQRAAELRNSENFLPMIAALPGVKAVSPAVNGSGFIARRAQSAQVSINGVEPGLESAIVNLDYYLVEGTARLSAGTVLLGKTLADDLGVRLGQTVRLTSPLGIEQVVTVTGLYQLGSGGLDRYTAYVSIGTARILFARPQGLTQIEIKLDDIHAADAMTRHIAALTGLLAKSWTDQAAQLVDALNAQAQVGYMLKPMALITIVIGVASALLLSTYRRRPEIGIMRAMGAAQWFVVTVFVLQGALIGLVGGLVGPGHGDRAMTALLEVRDLGKAFGAGNTETRVLQGLNLALEEGDLAALFGPSRSGKSTLLTILGTLMQPTSGSHVKLGQDLVASSDRELTNFRNLHIGFVFQFHNLLPDFTALENVLFPTAVHERRETETARIRGRELLTRMGLADRIDFPTANLSGGQKQRVARALMNRSNWCWAMNRPATLTGNPRCRSWT